jgi:photosystem II stability/assembly factor-like uncharacterized protein
MLSNLIQSFLGFSLLVVSFFTNTQLMAQKAPDRLKTIQQRQALENKSVLNPIKFRNIGPSIMSGRVVDIEGNPEDPTEFYVAYASGGLWHTTNNGQSFVPIFDSADVITIGDIAVNWKTRTIWVGTGEVNSSRSSYAGMGVFKSRDNGKTWQYLGLPESHHIGKILLHPSDDNIAWVAVLGHLYTPNKERGLYKTTDGGASWKQTLFIDDNTGVVDVDINPSNPNEVYAAAWYRTRTPWNFEESGKTSGIYKSVDGGNTFSLLTKQGAGFPVGEGVGRIGIAVYPKNPQIVYAIMDNNFHKPASEKKTDTVTYVLRDFEKLTKEQFMQLDPKKLDTFLRRNRMYPRYNAQMIMERVSNGSLKPTVIWEYLYDANTALFDTPIIGAEIYRSDDGGQSWKKTNTKDLTLYNTYGYYFGKIFVSPYNDQKLVITGFDIELSTDGGKTFSRIDKENVHADHHVAWIDPKRDDHFIIGNDGGCNLTYDNGQHWFKANTPSVGQFYSVFVDNARPYNVYGGLQDNGVWYGPSNNRENVGWHDGGTYAFKSIMGGDGMQVQVDTRDNTTAYTGFQFGNYSRLNRLNPRETSKRITPQHPLGERPFRFNWQTPVLISKHNQDVIYFGGNKLFRSFNKADTLVAISNDLTNGGRSGDVPFGTIATIAESPLRFGLLYVGTDDGNIQLTKDGGATWTLLNPAPAKKGQTSVLPQGLWVSRLIASQYKEGRVYATLNGYRNDDFNSYVYVSEDYGTTWSTLGRDLPAEPVNVIKEDPKNENILYLGTDGGLYVSFDRGQTFMMWNGGLPKSIPVHDIAIQERDNEIVLGTHGRSIYVSSLEDVQGLQKDKDWLKKKPAPKEQPERRFRNDD